VELRNVVYNYFSSDDPEGVLADTLVVFYGVHARLRNISPDHKWIETESFTLHGQTQTRYAGESSGKIMYEIVEMRSRRPDLFVGLDVMQQPSAYVDEIVHTWSCSHLAQQFPTSVWQRDALSTHMSAAAAKVLFFSHALQSLIGGGMTPVLQLCDTDFSFLLKTYLRQGHEEMLISKKNECRLAQTVETLDYGIEEMLSVLQHSLAKLRTKNQESNLTVAGLRRNGMLAWRPDLKAGKLVRADEQAWAQKLPEKSHRYFY